MTWGGRKMYAEKLPGLFSSPNIIPSDQIKQNEMGGACGLSKIGMQSSDGKTRMQEATWKRYA